MQIILVIIFFIAFIGISPKFFKWLAAINVVVVIVYFIGVRVLAFIFDAGKFGKNAGMFEENAIHILFLMFSIPVVMGVGVFFGIICYWWGQK